MNDYTTVVGSDVHKESIVAAIPPYGHSEVAEQVSIENHPKAIEKLVARVTQLPGKDLCMLLQYGAGGH